MKIVAPALKIIRGATLIKAKAVVEVKEIMGVRLNISVRQWKKQFFERGLLK